MPYFRDIAPATLRRLAPLFSTRLAKRDTHIVREGEEGSELYVLAQGAASIQKWSSDRKCFVEVAKITEDSDHTYFGARAPLRVQPQVLQEILRSLRPGELSAPRQLGEWHVLMRLEQLKPARFDQVMREQMQQDALNAFLDERVKRVLSGKADSLEPIRYDREL